MTRARSVSLIVAAAFCAGAPLHGQSTTDSVPAFLTGTFEDDYENRYTISAAEWFQLPLARYHIRGWHVAEQFLIAQNDSSNPGDRGRWTRIDWMPLEGMAPYEWAFCLSAYDAPTPEAAAATRIARRETPRTGCNGFPFSRMRRVTGSGH